jgi:subfamily B ATP-binding cassette protein MsbA
LFIIAVVGFLLGGGAEAYFATLLGDLVDSLGERVAQASLLIPILMLTTAVARGIGSFVGEVLLSQISFSVVHNIRTQLFDQLLLMPSAYFDAS